MRRTRNVAAIDEDGILLSVKKLCLDIDGSREMMNDVPVHKKLPVVNEDGEPMGDSDYVGVINPILKELAMLRSFRRDQLQGRFGSNFKISNNSRTSKENQGEYDSNSSTYDCDAMDEDNS